MSDLDLERYRRRAEEFVGALDLEYYEHFSGRKPRCDTAAVYDRYPELFTREAIDGLEELYAAAVDDEKLRLAYLLAFTVDGFMGEQTKHLGDEIANTEGEATITVDGETIGLRQAGVVQGNEPDRARRARIQAARLAATAEHLNPLLDTLWRRCHDLALELGYPDYKELYGTVARSRLRPPSRRTRGLLADTDGLYERVMDRLVRERLGVTLAELDFADLPALWRAEGFDGVFKGDALDPVAAPHAGRHGHRPRRAAQRAPRHRGPRAQVAARLLRPGARPGRDLPRASCPHGGQDDYGMLLHEAGHTEHFAHVRPDLAFEYRHLGDNAVTEGFAFIVRPSAAQPRAGWRTSWTSTTATTTCASPPSTTCTSCGATQPSWPTRPRCTRRRVRSRPCRPSTAAGSVRPPRSRCRRRTTSPTSTTASTAPATCAPGCSRARCASCCRRTSAWTGTRRATPGIGCKALWGEGQHLTAERLLLRHGGGRLNTDPLRHLFEQVLGR